ncbi:MAG: hypothetical protein AAGC74_06420 [Verrucomicrobiota bacterium]
MSCEKSENRGSVGQKKPASASQNISEKKKAAAIAFGLDVERRLIEGDTDYFLDSFRLADCILDSLSGVKLPADFQRGVRDGISAARTQMEENLRSARFDFVDFQEFEGQPGIVFRVRIDDGLEYVKYRLLESDEHPSGWLVWDAFPLSLGTTISELMKANYLPFLKQQNRSLFEKLISRKKDGLNLEGFAAAMKVIQLAKEPERRDGAQALVEGFDAETRRSRVGCLAEIFTLANFLEEEHGEERYLTALEEFEARYPNDPSLALMMIDVHILRKNFAAARETIRKLGEQIPDGDYLEFYEGWIDLWEKDYEEVERRSRMYLEKEPGDEEGYEMLMEAGFATNHHDVTAEALKALEEIFYYDYSGILEAPEWSAFVESEVGQEWARNRSQE